MEGAARLQTTEWVAARRVLQEYFPLHGVRPEPPDAPPVTEDHVNAQVSLQGYAQLEGVFGPGDPALEGRRLVVLLVPKVGILETTDTLHSVPRLRQVLGGLQRGRDGPPAELLLLGPASFVDVSRIGNMLRAEFAHLRVSRQLIGTFVVNPLTHVLSPQYRKLSEAEAAELERELCVPAGAHPVLRARDPAAVWLRARPGQLLEVRRNSHTAGEAIAYRIVE